jgi:hypothetical protein
MLNEIAVATLVTGLWAATAAAQPVAPQAGPAPGPIGASGAHRMRPTLELEIDTVAGQTHAKITSVHIWATGAWTFEDFRSKTPKTASGRISADALRALHAELARAAWQHTLTQPPCETPQIATEYLVAGKLVYTDPTCGDDLDAASQQALAYARGFVDGVMSTSDAGGQVGGPLIGPGS